MGRCGHTVSFWGKPRARRTCFAQSRAFSLPIGQNPAGIFLKGNVPWCVLALTSTRARGPFSRNPGHPQQGSPPERQSATSDVVESLDSAGEFFHDHQVLIVVHFVSNLAMSENSAGASLPLEPRTCTSMGFSLKSAQYLLGFGPIA
jgi:hypothetical protein